MADAMPRGRVGFETVDWFETNDIQTVLEALRPRLVGY